MNDSMALFAKLLVAEKKLSEEKQKADEVINNLKLAVSKAEYEFEAAKAAMQKHMEDNGVVEDLLEGDFNDFKISFTKPKEIVDITEMEALPDEFVRVKKEPKKKELLDYIKSFPEHKRPNWATLKFGEKTLTWRSVKKSKAKTSKGEV